MLQLSLCVLLTAVIQLTSSQPTVDVTEQEIDVTSCRSSEQVLYQLQQDVAELKAAIGHKPVTGELMINIPCRYFLL